MTIACRAAVFALVVSSTLALADSPSGSAGNWPRFRGPLGTGHSEEKKFPIEWGAADVAWRQPLPGVGQSSPIVWQDRIFLTAAQDGGRIRTVLCLDRSTGRIVWQKDYQTGESGPTHQMNQHASSTCCTDGKHVLSFFGKGGFYCHDFSGNLVWKRTDLGEFLSIWGTAASPVFVEGRVVLCCDQDAVLEKDQPAGADSKAFMIAVDPATGVDVWKVPRFGSRGWSTPVLFQSKSGTEMIVNGPSGLVAYDPKSGSTMWHCDRDTLFGEPAPVFHRDLVFGVGGRPGKLLAVKTGGKGDVRATRLKWSDDRGTRDLASPIVEKDLLFNVDMKGVCTCYNPQNGDKVWRGRLGGDITASPAAAGGKVYFVTRGGETVVVTPARSLKIEHRNKLPVEGREDFLASPAFSRGCIYLRSDRAIYAVGQAASVADSR